MHEPTPALAAPLLAWHARAGATTCPGSSERSALPRVGLGDHAAADAGGHRHPLLPALHGALPGRAGARRRVRWTRCCTCGRAWATTRAPATCTRAAQCIRDEFGGRVSARACRGSPRCPASAARPPARSSRSRAASAMPILDGNVKRVLARYFGVEGGPADTVVLKELWQLARGAARRSGTWPPTPRRSWTSAPRCACGANRCATPARSAATAVRAAAAASMRSPRRGARAARARRAGLHGGRAAPRAARCCSSGDRKAAYGAACGACRNSQARAPPATSSTRRWGRGIISRGFWPRLEHGFTHFDLSITPLLVHCAPQRGARPGGREPLV